MSEWTTEHTEHLARLEDAVCHRMRAKYVAGQREHGGRLWETAPHHLLDWAIDEAIDQVVYLLTLREQRERAER